MRRTLIALTSLGLLAGIAVGQDGDAAEAKAQIRARGEAYNRAIRMQDRKALTEILDPKGVFVDGNGKVLDAKAYLGTFVDPKVRYKTSSGKIASLRIFGDTATEIGTYSATGTFAGKPFAWKLAYTTVWVNRDGEWRVISDHSTPIVGKP